MKELISVFKDRKRIFKFILATLVCLVTSIFYKELYKIVPAYTIVEPINPFAPAIGLYLGPVGAVALLISNIFLEIMYGNSNFSLIVLKLISIFIFSYMPYKLWYTLGKKNDFKIPNLDDAYYILKYICIMFINSVCSTVGAYTIYVFYSGKYNYNFVDMIFSVYNNFDLPILCGIPVMLLLSAIKIGRITPNVVHKNINTNKYLYLLISFCILASANLFYLNYSSYNGLNIVSTVIIVLLVIIMLIYLQAPFVKKVDTVINSSDRSKFSMKGKVTFGFLIFGYFLIGFDVILFHIVLSILSDDYVLIIRTIYVVVGICTYYIFAIVLIVLKIVERKITYPLDKLSNAVTSYSKVDDYNNKDFNEKIKKLCSEINTKNEIGELAGQFSRMIDKIEEYCENLSKITEEREREKVEINLASKIQESILPKQVPTFLERDDFDIAASMYPAKMLGGDFYDYFMTDNNKLCFLIADVSGKGIPAALVMMSAKTTIKDYLSMNLDIVDVVKKVNMNLCKNNDVFMFITAFLAVVDLKTGVMDYVCAGHNPPLFRRNGGKFELLDVKSNCILAVDYYAEFVKQSIKLEHGDILFTYTDGVTEALNDLGQFFGVENLINTLNDKYYEDTYQIIPYLRSKLTEFTNGVSQSDDITMQIFKYK